MDRCDIAIIGTGPAGISAAITAKVRNKNILLFGSRKSSEKVYRATQIQNYPGLPQISGEELAGRTSQCRICHGILFRHSGIREDV